jgi:citrate synthase
MGFPVEMFPVLFAIGRMPGWLAQWEEGVLDPDQKIARPRQLYVGPPARDLDALGAPNGTDDEAAYARRQPTGGNA